MKQIMHDRYQLPYGVVTQDNVLTVDEIKYIHDIAKKKSHLEIRGTIGAGGDKGTHNEDYRRSDILFLYNDNDTQWLYDRFQSVVCDINEQYYGFQLAGQEPFQYTKYNGAEYGEYNWHVDVAPVTFDSHQVIDEHCVLRKITAVTLLSPRNEFTGGAFVASSHGKPMEVDMAIGRTIVFPSWVPHKVMPVLTGCRCTLVGWYFGNRFI